MSNTYIFLIIPWEEIIMKKKLLLLITVLCLTFTFATPLNVNAGRKFKLNKTSISLSVGKTYKLKVRNTKKSIRWSVKNKKIASVSKKGTVKAKKSGTTYVYAKVSGTNKKLKCKVRVFKKKSSSKSSSYVYITSTGKKYHRYKTCSNMRSPRKIKSSEAKKLGYTACKKCY